MGKNSLTPGEQLSELISEVVHSENPESGFLKNMDNLLVADGEFLEMQKKSIIFYTTRRLIHGASYALEKAMVHYMDSQNAIPVIKDYLTNNYSFSLTEEQANRLHALVYSCVDASHKDLSTAQRNKALEQFRRLEITTCYMCGVEIDFDSVDNKNSASVEHLFPSEYGGDSRFENLALSCKDCNKHKDDHMHPSDFHFEKISTKHDYGHKKFSKQLLVSKQVVAMWLKEGCECTICGKPASAAGMLSVFQKEPADSWHFLNIGVQCSAHNEG
ncbi:HNH endonuclease [Pontiellaceae bacterium B1224]|nr:HNH endonuclease [Pontiellaceae bacterium B1224]